jgi:hypothetical protein
MRRMVLLFAIITLLGTARAEAITVREIIELSKNGLGDEVLLALIEIERKVFPIDPETLKALKDARVSERVIIAMIRSGRTEPPAPGPVVDTATPPASEPQVVVIEHHDHHDVPPVSEVAVPVPVYFTLPFYVRTPRHFDGRRAHKGLSTVPFSSIGLPHSRIGLSAPPPKPTSGPPGWHAIVPLQSRSDAPGRGRRF